MKQQMKKSKRYLSVLLSVALVVASLGMGFGRLGAYAVTQAVGQMGSYRFRVQTSSQDCEGTGTANNLAVTVNYTDSTSATSDTITGESDPNYFEAGNLDTIELSPQLPAKPISSITFNSIGSDRWKVDWTALDYWDGSDWQQIASTGAFEIGGGTRTMTYPSGSYSLNDSSLNKTLTFSYNYSGSPAAVQIYSEQGATLPASNIPTFTRTGYTFTGWSPAVPVTGPGADITYKAQWTVNYYTITFDANGGAGGWSQSLAYGSTLTPPTVYKTGYSFTGWNPTPPGTVPASNATYTAQWSAETYFIIFDANGGSGSMSSQGIQYGASAALTSNAFSRTGYSFTGWNTAADGSGTSYANGATFGPMPANNVTLYAQWSINSYTITFDANGGTGGWSQSLAFGSILLPPTVAKTGYSFAGWNPTPPATVPAANATYTAQWNINTYFVIFDANGGSGSMGSQGIQYASSAVLASNAFTRTGYTFTGWNTAANGSGTSYGNGATFGPMPANNVTLYAQWSINTYYVIFDANGGGGSMANQDVIYGATSTLNINTYLRTGYTFAGWNTAADGSGTSYANGATFGPMPANNVTLYAQWSVNSYTITFDANGGTGGWSQLLVYGSTLTPPTVTRTGYTFNSWSPTPPGTVPASNATYTAQWTVNTYYVIFNANGGSGSMSNQGIQYGSSAALISNAFIRADYTFTGWNTAADGSGLAYADEANFGPMGASNVTLYAQWSASTYYVIFNANGGSGFMSDQAIIFGTSANLNENTFTRQGHTFSGWNTAADGSGTTYTNGGNYGPMPANNVTLYAQWTVNSYTITFDANGGEGGWSQLLAYGSNISPPTVNREGYAFTGWSPLPPATVPAADAVYTAQWSVNTYFVHFDANGGSGTMNGQGIAYGETAELTSNMFSYEGHTFAGWNTAADGSGASYPDGAAYGPMGAADVTLYAQWNANTYNVVFDANGGSGSMPNQGIPYNDSAALAAGTFTRPYYTFAGWNTAADGSGTFFADEAVYGPMGAADVTLYAVWQRVPVTLAKRTGSTTVFAAEAGVNYIYGLEEGLSEQAFRNQFIQVGGDGRLQITKVEGSFGTGTRVDLYDNVTNALLKTYWVVIFGDVDGDGYVTAADENLIDAAASYQSEFEYGTAAFYAADIMQDGGVDALDLNIVSAATSYTGVLDQANPGVII